MYFTASRKTIHKKSSSPHKLPLADALAQLCTSPTLALPSTSDSTLQFEAMRLKEGLEEEEEEEEKEPTRTSLCHEMITFAGVLATRQRVLAPPPPSSFTTSSASLLLHRLNLLLHHRLDILLHHLRLPSDTASAGALLGESLWAVTGG